MSKGSMKPDKDEERKQQYRQLVKWFFKYRLRSGVEGCYPISSVEEKDRLWDGLQRISEEETKFGFFEFDSDTHRIVMQPSQLAFFQFLFEPPVFDFCENTENNKKQDDKKESEKEENTDHENDEEEDEYEYEEGWNSLKVYFIENQKPVILKVDFDEPNNPEDEEDYGEVGNFLWDLLYLHEEGQLVNVTDEDGETAFFRGSSIALVEIPLKVLHERLLNPSEEDSDE